MTTLDTQRDHLLEMIKRFDTALLITNDGSGELQARPMAVAGVDPDGTMWFLTHAHSQKVAELLSSPSVNVSFQDAAQFVSVSGQGHVVRDRGKVDELWKAPYKAWFKDGKDDPNLALIKVTPTRGEYWDNTGVNKLKYFFEAAKAMVTNSTPKADENQHAQVALD